MTMPWLMNCPHLPDAWCLACVRELGEKYERACGSGQGCSIPDLISVLERIVVRDGMMHQHAAHVHLHVRYIAPLLQNLRDLRDMLGVHKPLFRYERIGNPSELHYRIHDANDNALCFCYTEANAIEIVAKLNRATTIELEAKP